MKPKPKEAPKVNRTVPANTTKHAATPAAAPKPATKARGTEESAIAPIPKPAEKEVKPSTAIPESSSKPQAKKTPVPAAAVPAPAAAASTKDVIIAGAQCGGRGGECSSKPDYKCADAAFAGYSCAAGYVCKREVGGMISCAVPWTRTILGVTRFMCSIPSSGSRRAYFEPHTAAVFSMLALSTEWNRPA